MSSEFSPQLRGAVTSKGESGQTKHAQLKDFIVSQIESGQLNPGESLPSEIRLSEMLGISRSTVRQALAGLEQAGIVRRFHGKGTYVHDQARQRLKKGQDLYALILPEIDVGYYSSLQMNFESAAASLHNQVIICNSNNDVDKQGNAILQLMDLNVAGVAIVPTTSPESPAFHVRQLHERGIPVVCCSRPIAGVQVPLLAIPFEEVGYRAGALLRDYGHETVAFFCPAETSTGAAYLAGFRRGFGTRQNFHTYFGKGRTTDVNAQEELIQAQLELLLNAEQRVTAIFATYDPLAELIYVLLSRMGVKVPEEISILGFGGMRRQGALVSRLTSVTIDEQLMGNQAIELLEQMREKRMAIDSSVVRTIPLGLSEGRSLCKISR
ncbi:substrate-binding domain-containing protein [Planctomicrobium sp. SH527]|uniref:LacI family DNA-binding transcriptional regulator n=1 Tax=Planctomicrobium sp. SH527 TaxID=3448123 RepID=UPI003F5BCFCF